MNSDIVARSTGKMLGYAGLQFASSSSNVKVGTVNPVSMSATPTMPVNEDQDAIHQSRYVADRDPNHIHDDLNIFFEDIIAEPTGTQTIDSVWNLSDKTFAKTSVGCYRCLTAVFALPAAFLWAVLFACLFWQYIWCITPVVKFTKFLARPAREICQLGVSIFVVPCFDAMAYLLGRIKVTTVATTSVKQDV